MGTLRLFAVLVALSAVPAAAQETPSLEQLPLEKIEEAFWQCDQASSKTFLSSSEAAICSYIFEVLKQRKFQGDFSKFYQWWQQNKHRAK